MNGVWVGVLLYHVVIYLEQGGSKNSQKGWVMIVSRYVLVIQAFASLVRKLKSRPSIFHLIMLRYTTGPSLQKMQDALRRAHDTSVRPDVIHYQEGWKWLVSCSHPSYVCDTFVYLEGSVSTVSVFWQFATFWSSAIIWLKKEEYIL